MPNYKVTLDTKDKRTVECHCATFEELNAWIDETFNMDVKNIKYKKPRLKVNAYFYLRINHLLSKKSKMESKSLS